MGIAQAAFGASGATALSISASSVSKSASGFIGCGHPGSTNTPALSVSGGSGNYSFVWERVSGTPTYGPWACSNTGAQNPTWRAPEQVCDNTFDSSEVWQVTVTDESSGQQGTTSINVTITWVDIR